MARPARPWFRFYVEAVHDRKLRRLKPEYRWLFVACLSAARQSPDPGRLLVGDDDPMLLEDLADYAGVPASTARAGMAALCAAGIVIEDGGVWTVPKWEERQYESDTSRARTARWRHSDGDCDVTTLSPVTPPDTETDTETDVVARKRARTPTADTFELTDTMRSWAVEHVPWADLERERFKWLDWALAAGKTFRDFDAGFRTWLGRVHEPVRGIGRSAGSGPAAFPEPARAVLGRGVNAEPLYELDEQGNAVPRRAS